jgi:hypothetical protein
MYYANIPVNQTVNSIRAECSREYLADRAFERPLTFAEIVDLSEKCDLWEVETASIRAPKPPMTFTIPTTQMFASISRVVE